MISFIVECNHNLIFLLLNNVCEYFVDLNEKKKAINLYKRGIEELEKGIAIEVNGRGLSLHFKALIVYCSALGRSLALKKYQHES